MPTVAVIIPAAGKSSRFGGREKKPFVSLDGRPVWQRSAELFWTRDDVSKVYLVIAPGDREEFRRRFTHLIAFANAELVDGGVERFDSVANALVKVPETVPAVVVADTLKRVDPGSSRVVETIPRGGLWLAQTPQVFRRDWLADAYAHHGSLGGAVTDDAQLVESAGHPVVVVPGSAENFKITTQDDLDLAVAIIKARLAKPSSKPPARFDDEAKW